VPGDNRRHASLKSVIAQRIQKHNKCIYPQLPAPPYLIPTSTHMHMNHGLWPCLLVARDMEIRNLIVRYITYYIYFYTSIHSSFNHISKLNTSDGRNIITLIACKYLYTYVPTCNGYRYFDFPRICDAYRNAHRI
jgi:hypothetical protein